MPVFDADPHPLPSPGAMLSALTGSAIDAAAHDRELTARLRANLY